MQVPWDRPPLNISSSARRRQARCPTIDVLGIHYLKVRPDRREAFDTFVARTLNPAVAGLRPDLRLLYYKAVRGPDTGSYITIFALTRESRDKYWPGGADSDALRAAFAPVKTHTKELLTYLVEGSALTDEKFAAAVSESRLERFRPGREARSSLVRRRR